MNGAAPNGKSQVKGPSIISVVSSKILYLIKALALSRLKVLMSKYMEKTCRIVQVIFARTFTILQVFPIYLALPQDFNERLS